MCLYCDKKEIKIAENDIKCYKIVQSKEVSLQSSINKQDFKYQCLIHEIDGSKCTYLSPFLCFPVIFNKKLHCKNFSLEVERNFMKGIFEANMFHSYTSIDSCHCFLEFIKNRFYNKTWLLNSYRIVECIIPKGAKYMEGYDANDLDCYGSETIIYNEII